ncbi:MAG: prolipoprotein diacylglyceryl transferase [Opitutaceae bacterium]|jgi:phosphatidylglycerol:prolipoprotein diacylglycerol transferase|nr:prolipoprotein diacylglyceryl transferase [Opitutaceae bacterium]
MFHFAHWTHDLSPFVPFLRFSENFGVRWYGLAYVASFVAAVWLLTRYARAGRSQLPAAKAWDFILYIIIGVMAGGRLGYFLFYRPEDLLHEPLLFFKLWEGGMASHGGFAGVALAILLFARVHKIPALHLGDLIATTAPLGLLLGRVANFINGELWGKPAGHWWCVIFPEARDGVPRHPSQLYEAFFEGAVLLAFMQWRVWRTDAIRAQTGRITGEFFAAYAIARCVCEQFREPDASLIAGVSRGTFYSIFVLIAGLALIAHASKTKRPPGVFQETKPGKNTGARKK